MTTARRSRIGEPLRRTRLSLRQQVGDDAALVHAHWLAPRREWAAEDLLQDGQVDVLQVHHAGELDVLAGLQDLAAAADKNQWQVLAVVVATVHTAHEVDDGVVDGRAVGAVRDGGQLGRQLVQTVYHPPATGGEAAVGVTSVLQVVIAAKRLVGGRRPRGR